MTEAEWDVCPDPMLMLEHFRTPIPTREQRRVGPYRVIFSSLIEEPRTHVASERKLRLFTAACIRLLWPPTLPGERDIVEALEELALGKGDRSPVAIFHSFAKRIERAIEDKSAELGLCGTCYRFAGQEAMSAARALVSIVRFRTPPLEKVLAAFLHDLFGPLPFWIVACDPNWLRWNHGTIRFLAQEVYDHMAFERLPLLADALEDAGCTDPKILDHCRGRGTHVRGCWVVDLILGKE